MKKITENLREIYEREPEAVVCFKEDGSVAWINAAGREKPGWTGQETIGNIFPWVDARLLPKKKNFLLKNPCSALEYLEVTGFYGGERCCVAVFQQEDFDSFFMEHPIWSRVEREIRFQVGDILTLLKEMRERYWVLMESELTVANMELKLCSILKSVYNQELYRVTFTGEELNRLERWGQPFFDDLFHQLRLISVQVPLDFSAKAELENVVIGFDTRLVETALLNFVSLAISNAFEQGRGALSIEAKFVDDRLRIDVCDSLGGKLLKAKVLSWDEQKLNAASYFALSYEMLDRLIKFFNGEIFAVEDGEGYRVSFTLPARRVENAGDFTEPLIFSEIDRRYSLPEIMLSDRGSEFSWK